MAIKHVKIQNTTVDINDSRIPSLANNANKVLSVNSTANGLEWKNASGDTESDVFVVEFTLPANADMSESSVSGITANKSMSEILAAFRNKKTVIGVLHGMFSNLYAGQLQDDCLYFTPAVVVAENSTNPYTLTFGSVLSFGYIMSFLLQCDTSTDTWTLEGPVLPQHVKVNGSTYSVEEDSNIIDLGTVTNFAFSGDTEYIADTTAHTVEFDAQRGYKILQVGDTHTQTSLALTLNSSNMSDNYILVRNWMPRNDLRVLIRSLQYNTTAVSNAIVPNESIVVPAGNAVELSYATDGSYGIVTVSPVLATSIT